MLVMLKIMIMMIIVLVSSRYRYKKPIKMGILIDMGNRTILCQI